MATRSLRPRAAKPTYNDDDDNASDGEVAKKMKTQKAQKASRKKDAEPEKEEPEALIYEEVAESDDSESSGDEDAKAAAKAPRAAPARRGQKKDDGKGDTLYEVVRKGRAALQPVADQWVARYEANRKTAMAELLSFFVHSSGFVKNNVAPNLLNSQDAARGFEMLMEEIDDDAVDYPFKTAAGKNRKFYAAFVELWDRIVKTIKDSALCDGFMLEVSITWLTAFASSQVRAFRHTGTVASLKLGTTLASVLAEFRQQLDTFHRQIDTESKRGKQASQEKLTQLRHQQTAVHDRITALERAIDDILKGVFIHRYRDTAKEIRAASITELGEWIVSNSTTFLKDGFLKYVGWLLHDKDFEVRLATLDVMKRLYAVDEFAPQLETFTQRFKDRLVAMLRDVNPLVIARTIKLFVPLLRYGVFTDSDLSAASVKIFESNPKVSRAAGRFIAHRLEEEATFAHESNPKKSKDAKLGQAKATLAELAKFAASYSGVSAHADALVGGLWKHVPAVREWAAYTALLDAQQREEDTQATQGGSQSDQLNAEEETSLVQILVAACRRTVAIVAPIDGPAPPGLDAANRKPLAGKEKEAAVADVRAMTLALARHVPELLVRYGADSQKVECIAAIAQCLDPAAMAEGRLTKQMDSTIKAVQDLFSRLIEPDALQQLSATLRHFAVEGRPSQATASAAVVAAAADAAAEIKRHSKSLPADDRTESVDERHFPLVSALRRFLALALQNNVELDAAVSSIVERAAKTSVHPEVLLLALQTASVAFIRQATEPSADEDIDAYIERRDRFVDMCASLLENDSDKVQEAAFGGVVDAAATSVLMQKPLKDAMDAKAAKRQAKGKGRADDANKENADGNRNDQDVAPVYVLPAAVVRKLVRALDTAAFQPDHAGVVANIDDGKKRGEDVEELWLALERRRSLVAKFLMLVCTGCIPPVDAAIVFGRLGHFGDEYGDVAKYAFARLRDRSVPDLGRLISDSLKMAFNEAADGEKADVAVEVLRRLVAALGTAESARVNQALVDVHTSGIAFALSGDVTRVSLFAALKEIVPRLKQTDAGAVLKALDLQAGQRRPDKEDDAWIDYFAYRGLLLKVLKDPSALPATASAAKSAAKSARRSSQKPGAAGASGKKQQARRSNASQGPTAQDRAKMFMSNVRNLRAALVTDDAEAASRKRRPAEDSDEIQEFEDDASEEEEAKPTPAAKRGSPRSGARKQQQRGASRSPARKRLRMDEHDDEEEAPRAKPAAKSPVAAQRRPNKRTLTAVDSDEAPSDAADEDGSEREEVVVRPPAKRTKPSPPENPVPAKKSMSLNKPKGDDAPRKRKAIAPLTFTDEDLGGTNADDDDDLVESQLRRSTRARK